MPAVVTQSSTVTCGHGGTIDTVGTATMTVGGSPVLVAAGIAGQSVDPVKKCTIVPPPASNKACTKAVSVTSGTATKLFVGGNPVVLATLTGTTDGELGGVTPQTLLAAVVTQTLLTAV